MRRKSDLDVTVITGLSGAGRSEAAKVLEDLGWFVIDNLPPALIDKMMSLASSAGEFRRVALVIDARGGKFFTEAAEALEKLREKVGRFRMVFLEASDSMLVRRFELNRRRHPLAQDDSIGAGIRKERQLMNLLRDNADLIIDTSDLSVRDLHARLGSYFEGASIDEGLKTTVISFGYKFGLPTDADLVLDCRFLPNPHWIAELRPMSGLEDPVRDYVMEQEGTNEFLDRLDLLLDTILPGYRNEGRHYLTVAVGCTGGRHRSVVLAEAICEQIEKKGFAAKVIHRDVERAPSTP
jgi:RNase adapter protein RapZ